MSSERLLIRDTYRDHKRVGIAVFFVAIMVGATMFAAYHRLPSNDENPFDGRVLVWDMNIYDHIESQWRYQATGLSLKMQFPNTMLSKDIQLKNRDVEISYEVINLIKGESNGECIRPSEGIVEGNTITFPNAFENADLQFRVCVNGLKEYLILNKPPAFLSGDLVLRSQLHYPPTALEPTFAIDEGDGKASSLDGSISMMNPYGDEVLRIANPVVFDSADVRVSEESRSKVDEGPVQQGIESDYRGVSVIEPACPGSRNLIYGSLRVVENEYGAEMAIQVPYEYLMSKDTVYPVYIDPTLTSPITDNQWYSDALILLESNLEVASGGALNLYNVTLQVDHDSVNEYNIDVSSNATMNIYRSVVEHNSSKGTNQYQFNSSGYLTIQDSFVNYTYSGVRIAGGNASFRNLTLGHSSGEGLYATGGNITVYNSRIHNCSDVGIEIHNSNVSILDTDILDDQGAGVLLTNATGNISNTQVWNCGGSGIEIVSSNAVNLVNCTVFNNSGTGVVLSSSNGLATGLLVNDNLHGMNLTNGTNATVNGCTIESNSLNGLNIVNANPSLSENSIKDHLTGVGLFIINSTPSTDSDQIISNGIGVLADNTTTTLSDIDVLWSEESGIEVVNASLTLDNCTIEYSDASDLKVGNQGYIVTVNTYFNKGDSIFTDNTGNLTVKWYLDLKVLSDFDIPWTDQDVIIYQKGGAVVFDNKTNAEGKIPTQLLTEFIQNADGIQITTPHTLVAGGSDSNVYMGTSKSLTIYHKGDMDGDLVPDVLENLTNMYWYEAEGHGYGASQLVDDGFALNQKAMASWNDTTLIIQPGTFFDTFEDPNLLYKVLFRAKSTTVGDNVSLDVTNESSSSYIGGIQNFSLGDDYDWYSTGWFTPSTNRILVNITSSTGNSGEARVDVICIAPKWKVVDWQRAAVEGQITAPLMDDTDGDIMPDGGERRNCTIWIEPEHENSLLDEVWNYNYSNGWAVEFPMDSNLQIQLADFVPIKGGPLEEGNYIIKVRASSSESSSLRITMQDTSQFYDSTVQVNPSGLTWYTLYELWMDSSYINPIMTLMGLTGTTVVDKIGLVMMVDDPDPFWNSKYDLNPSADAGGQTPAILGDVVVATAQKSGGGGGPHIVGIDGVTGQGLWENSTGSSDVTSPTSSEFGILYCVYDTQLSQGMVRLIDEETGNDIWNAQVQSTTTLLGQAVLANQVVVADSGSIQSFSIDDGSQCWSYSNPPYTFLSSPVIYKDHVIMLAYDSQQGYYIQLFNSTGNRNWSLQLLSPDAPLGSPTVVNGKIVIGRIASSGQTLDRLEAYSFNTQNPPTQLWSYSNPVWTLETEPIVGGDSIIAIWFDTISSNHFVVRIGEITGMSDWSNPTPGFSGQVLSLSPCYVDGRIYYIVKTNEPTEVFLRCVDTCGSINTTNNPLIFDRIVSTNDGPEELGTPILGDLEGDGYLEVIVNLHYSVHCREGGGVWYSKASPWPNYHRDPELSGNANYQLPYFTVDPDDLDMDGDGLRDGLESFAMMQTERFEFEDVYDFSTCWMGSDFPAEAGMNGMNLNFFHQTGIALRSVDPSYDDRAQVSGEADSWTEVIFNVSKSGQYELLIEPVNGFESKSSSVIVRGAGFGGGIYTNSGDGYNYQASRSDDRSGDAVFNTIWLADDFYLKKLIKNAVYIELDALVDTQVWGDIPFTIPSDGFTAHPSAVRNPSFDLDQVYVQGYLQACLDVNLSVGTTYKLRVGLDLDLIPEDLLDNPPFPGVITRIDILDLDFGLAMRKGCDPFDDDVDADTVKDGYEYEMDSFPFSPDADEDGISDKWELEIGTDPGYRDSDFDGIRDRIELGNESTDTDPYTMWDSHNTTSSLWERVMKRCGGNPENLSVDTNPDFPNWDADSETTTDPTNPDSDGDGLPDGVIDGWGYDPVANSNGQYNTQATNLYLYEDAFNKAYREKYWGFVGVSDNIAQVWEGEDFNLNGEQKTNGTPWAFDNGSVSIEDIGRWTGEDETNASCEDSDSDSIEDGWEVLYSQEYPFYTVVGGSSFYSMDPTNPTDAGWDVDSKPDKTVELGADPDNDGQLMSLEGTHAYAMKYVPTASDINVLDIEVEINPQTNVKADCYELEVFDCPTYAGLDNLQNRIIWSRTSTDGEDGMYLFRNMKFTLLKDEDYWFVVRYRNADFKLPFKNGTSADTAICDDEGMWQSGYDLQFHLVIYSTVSDPDALTNLEEYCAGTNPKQSNTDLWRRQNVEWSDELNDSVECHWVLRSSAPNGSYEYSGYLNATFIQYDGDSNGTDWYARSYWRTDGEDIYDAPIAPFSGAGKSLICIYTLKDGTQILLNQTQQAIYVWKPGSSPFDTSQYENGTSYYSGQCVKFTWTGGEAEPSYSVSLGFRGSYLFLSDPFDIDTDDDGITDGMEVRWWEDCNFSEAEGSSADTLNNARDRDSDNDGLMDLVEILWDQDIPCDRTTSLDWDNYKGMVDRDSDGDNITDGKELDRSTDTDEDGSSNIYDIDSDGDGLVDGWAEGYRWNWSSELFEDYQGGTQGTFDPWEGEDKNKNKKYDRDANETSPIRNDTDNDGLYDGYGNGTGSIPFGELTKHSRFGYTANDITEQLDPDTDNDGLLDGVEVKGWLLKVRVVKSASTYEFEWKDMYVMSDPTIVNTDGDLLNDSLEYRFTNATANDTDGDGWWDHVEDDNRNGRIDGEETNPCNADTDFDRNPDGFLYVDDHYWGEDIDRDGKYLSGDSNPLNPDSDGDLLPDGAEYKLSLELKGNGYNDADGVGGINILDPDADNDGLIDWEENCDSDIWNYDSSNASPETNPYNSDTDGDGLLDGAEPGRSTDADGDGYSNGHDPDSNNASGTDYEDTFVIFRTNAQDSNNDGKHEYNLSNVWISVDKNVCIWSHSEEGKDYNLDLSWSNAAYKYVDYNETMPGNLTQNPQIVVYKVWPKDEDEKANVFSPEGYILYNTTDNNVVMEVNSNLYYIFAKCSSEPSGYEDSKRAVATYVYNHQEVYDYRFCLSEDVDLDGVAGTLDPDDNDADTDDDGVPDGKEILGGVDLDCDTDGLVNWCDPDSDGDGITDGTEMGYTKPVPDALVYSGTDTDAKFSGTQRKTWTKDEDPSTRTNPLVKDTDNDGLPDGWNDANNDGIFANESVGESTFDRSYDVAHLDPNEENFNGEVESDECDPEDGDTDDDGIGDNTELTSTPDSDPSKPDTDGDGLWDGQECGRVTGVNGTDMAIFRPDMDPNSTTNPDDIDTDDDGLDDGFEDINLNGRKDWNETMAEKDDTDGDNLLDGIEDNNTNHVVDIDSETNKYLETDPLRNDTDCDGLLDGDEDLDNDGVWESNQYETNPRWLDTDDDGLSDGIETGGWNISAYFEATGEKRAGYPRTVYSNATLNDTDGDGLFDGAEFENATDPTFNDTDRDGILDIDELNAPEPSDPCGVEGTPPNLSKLDVDIVKIKERFGPLWITKETRLNLSVRATDNVGLSWLKFKLEDKGEVTWRFASGSNNSTAYADFTTNAAERWVSGWDLNITVEDVNGNAGYLEKHLPSSLEKFIAWVLKGLTALTELIIEWASKAIDWIWDAITDRVNRFIDPRLNSAYYYNRGISDVMNKMNYEYVVEGQFNPNTEKEMEQAIVSPFFTSVCVIGIVITLVMSIIKFFIPILAWLLLAVIVLIMVLLLVYIGTSVSEEQCDVTDIDTTKVTSDPVQTFLNFYHEQNEEETRESVEWYAFLIALIPVIIGIYQLKKEDYRWPEILSFILSVFSLALVFAPVTFSLGDEIQQENCVSAGIFFASLSIFGWFIRPYKWTTLSLATLACSIISIVIGAIYFGYGGA